MTLTPLRTDVATNDPNHAAIHNEERTRINVLAQVAYPYFDVTAYGAIGDGVADDTLAIEEAFAAAAVNGGTVVFPTCVGYRITDTLVGLQNSGGVVVKGYGMP